MPRKLADTRQPKSEAEEADWHATPEGRRITQREFARALRDGTLSRSPGLDHPKTRRNVLEQLLEQARQNASRAISIRIPIADLEHAKRIAERTGVGYQTVLKRAIREGLKKAG
jgi:hypothetical protein